MSSSRPAQPWKPAPPLLTPRTAQHSRVHRFRARPHHHLRQIGTEFAREIADLGRPGRIARRGRIVPRGAVVAPILVEAEVARLRRVGQGGEFRGGRLAVVEVVGNEGAVCGAGVLGFGARVGSCWMRRMRSTRRGPT